MTPNKLTKTHTMPERQSRGEKDPAHSSTAQMHKNPRQSSESRVEEKWAQEEETERQEDRQAADQNHNQRELITGK